MYTCLDVRVLRGKNENEIGYEEFLPQLPVVNRLLRGHNIVALLRDLLRSGQVPEVG